MWQDIKSIILHITRVDITVFAFVIVISKHGAGFFTYCITQVRFRATNDDHKAYSAYLEVTNQGRWWQVQIILVWRNWMPYVWLPFIYVYAQKFFHFTGCCINKKKQGTVARYLLELIQGANSAIPSRHPIPHRSGGHPNSHSPVYLLQLASPSQWHRNLHRQPKYPDLHSTNYKGLHWKETFVHDIRPRHNATTNKKRYIPQPKNDTDVKNSG